MGCVCVCLTWGYVCLSISKIHMLHVLFSFFCLVFFSFFSKSPWIHIGQAEDVWERVEHFSFWPLFITTSQNKKPSSPKMAKYNQVTVLKCKTFYSCQKIIDHIVQFLRKQSLIKGRIWSDQIYPERLFVICKAPQQRPRLVPYQGRTVTYPQERKHISRLSSVFELNAPVHVLTHTLVQASSSNLSDCLWLLWVTCHP